VRPASAAILPIEALRDPAFKSHVAGSAEKIGTDLALLELKKMSSGPHLNNRDRWALHIDKSKRRRSSPSWSYFLRTKEEPRRNAGARERCELLWWGTRREPGILAELFLVVPNTGSA